MGFIGDTVESIRSIQIRQVLAQIISLGDALHLIP
jgi:signal peptidase